MFTPTHIHGRPAQRTGNSEPTVLGCCQIGDHAVTALRLNLADFAIRGGDPDDDSWIVVYRVESPAGVTHLLQQTSVFFVENGTPDPQMRDGGPAAGEVGPLLWPERNGTTFTLVGEGSYDTTSVYLFELANERGREIAIYGEDLGEPPPFSTDQLRGLFERLDEASGKGYECDHDYTLTKTFFEEQGIPPEPSLRWLGENGAGCDCEVIFNVEPQWGQRVGFEPKE